MSLNRACVRSSEARAVNIVRAEDLPARMLTSGA